MDPWDGDFSFQFLRKLLAHVRGFAAVRPLRDAIAALEGSDPTVLLRHDVDVDLAAALAMAEFEHTEEVRATYCIFTRAPRYDVGTTTSRQQIRAIAELGHDLGLHYDASQVKPEDLESGVREECERLEWTAGTKVEVVSFHVPHASVLHGPLHCADRINANAALLMQDYVSDSAGRWREGNPLERLTPRAEGVTQVLIHPIWWGDAHLSAAERLEELYQSLTVDLSAAEAQRIDDELARTLPSIRRLVRADKGSDR